MTFIKRRWPDLLIATLVVLLLFGFGTLLLGNNRSAPTATTEPTPETTTTEPTTTTATAPTTTPDTATGSDSTAAPSSTPEEQGTIPTAPVTDLPTIPAQPVTPDTTPTPPATTDETATATPEETPTPGTTSVTPRDGGAVATSDSRTPTRNDYRISLGTYANADDARAKLSGVTALGYTVYPIDIGSGVVAQVGPFADADRAQEALADIQRAAPGALVYRPRNAPATAPTENTGTTATTPSTPTPPEAATPAPETTPASPNTPVYLQVGAFNSVERAQTLVQQLRDLGYAPTVNAPAGGKVTVLVGPYTSGPLERTETRLGENGIEHFRVR
ncbi:SPOR domain-containing protein [Deinococcus maricopensis]|uniref:Sporulation domain-containing protein n=1 Tax=Deinococcus maricopensis (strain DSM 21211 / LMG 22137 / NRRL B-23946 / LB-34) TaxID=709986 RepID=E8U8C9_DEIML|nr:SPOR domain-containing protein [Deinococcus maricopensis]ADV67318.1 Sporulation domain-containing protein [Deinococcus maricopensis DSM 21211]